MAMALPKNDASPARSWSLRAWTPTARKRAPARRVPVGARG